jgi:hypothetical protein
VFAIPSLELAFVIFSSCENCFNTMKAWEGIGTERECKDYFEI